MTALRGGLFFLYFWLASALMMLGLAPLLLIGSRAAIIWAMRAWAAATLFGLRIIGGIGLDVEGRENIPLGGALIASKHLSMWETIAFHLLLPDPAIVMKSELERVPLYGRYARAGGMIIVDRQGGARAMRGMLSQAKAEYAAGRQVVIFPEGTRVVPGAPPDYKPGIAALYARLAVPCVPVALNSGLFWPKRGSLLRTGKISIAFLEPIPAGLARQDFESRLQSAIEERTGLLLQTAQRACG